MVKVSHDEVAAIPKLPLVDFRVHHPDSSTACYVDVGQATLGLRPTFIEDVFAVADVIRRSNDVDWLYLEMYGYKTSTVRGVYSPAVDLGEYSESSTLVCVQSASA